MIEIPPIWSRLIEIRGLRFVARSAHVSGWNGRGEGTVEVNLVGDSVVTFAESGSWQPATGETVRFRNVFRWTRLEPAESVRLEHLRFGPESPVYLFDLVPNSETRWYSASAHVCRADCYRATMELRQDYISLRWSVTGPKKSEVIEYTYW